jgi:Spy/CpxP family protein refolding chaperone
MSARFFLTVAAAILVFGSGVTLATAAQAERGKTCHMEQQCHWENFKKVCVWVKVCR